MNISFRMNFFAGVATAGIPITVRETEEKKAWYRKLVDYFAKRTLKTVKPTELELPSNDTRNVAGVELEGSAGPSLTGAGSDSKKFFGVSIGEKHSGLLVASMLMIAFAMLTALGDPLPYKAKLDFNEALYCLLPAVLWLAVFLSSFIFSLIPIWRLGSKRDFLIPLLFGFAYGVAFMGVKASAFYVLVKGHKIYGFAFVPIYFLAFCLVVGPVIYYFMK